ncbi:Regulator of ribonuclease activity B [Mucilaginibacter gossypiicola]|uniref:Regulator of ribonuclease activity B n=1 Tax=Mucilaginibacter gossypiicola TaxID=551995 RepID=A0A1H8CWG5_9SPHI|nr:ribonuclease E inhibitor RraB [Mucilaginibacter gossypiicola]SEM98784.1 Regulator of ribonuclease activity B [Mucilaginibacter gossypiicola]
MGLFSFLSKKDNRQFVSAEAFEEKSTIQLNMLPVLMEKLRELNVDEDRELMLEFFFYTNAYQKAQAFAQELSNLSYQVKYGIAEGAKKLFLITGWTTKVKMSDAVVAGWINQMCNLGYKFDCEFDGWGTIPDQ